MATSAGRNEPLHPVHRVSAPTPLAERSVTPPALWCSLPTVARLSPLCVPLLTFPDHTQRRRGMLLPFRLQLRVYDAI